MTDNTKHFQSVMRAAENAYKAGDEAATRELVKLARHIYETSQNDISIRPPRAEEMHTPTPKRPDVFGDTIADATAGPRELIQSGFEQTKEGGARNVAIGGGKMLLGGMGTVYGAAAGAAAEVIGQGRTQEEMLARDLMMAGQVAVPELAGVSGTVRAASSTARAAEKAERLAAREPSAAERTRQAAADLGVTPSLGASGRGGAQAAAVFEKVPGTQGPIARDADRFVGEVEEAFQRTREGIGEAVSPADSGATIQAALGRSVDRFKTQAEKRYLDVGREIPADMPVTADNTVRAVREAAEVYAQNPEIASRLGIDQWVKLADDLGSGANWAVLSDLRSKLGEAIGKTNGPLVNMDQGRIKQLYATLTADMEAMATAAGPKALKKWKSASEFYKNGSTRIAQHFDKVVTAKSPEAAFELLVSSAQGNRASSNLGRLRSIKAGMKPGEWREFSASLLERLGMARPGQQNAQGDAFSVARYLSEYSKLSPDAKRIIFEPGVRRQLEKLGELGEAAKRADSQRNFSNTGLVNSALSTAAGFSFAPGTTVAILAAANVGARAMTNQRFLVAINKASEGNDRVLRALARSKSPLAADAQAVLNITAANQSTEPRRAVNQ